MSLFSCITPFQLVVICAGLTFLISDNNDADELNVLGNVIVAVGGLILAVAAQKEFLKSTKDTNDLNDDISKQKKDILKQIEDLKEKYITLERTTR